MKSLNGTWDLMTIDKNGVKENNPSKDRTVTLTFKDDESTGEISGKDICGNTVFGDYTLSPTNSVKIDRFGGTKIGCSGWASDFWGLIREAVAYEVDNEQLKIYFNDNSNVLIFKRT